KVEQPGLGKLKIIPKKGESYQAILEDDLGNINFFDLPKVGEEGAFITYQEDEAHLKLRCQLSQTESDSLNLILTDGSVIHQFQVLPNVYHSVSKEILPRGVVDVRYISKDGALVAERSILISQAPLEVNRPERGTYGTREKVTIEPGLDSGVYSISVRRKTDPKLGGHQHAVWTNALQRILDTSVNPSNYLSTDEPDTEALLLASNIRSVTAAPRQVKLLPEVREEILTGTISDSVGSPVAKQKVSLTFPGSSFQLRIGESDVNGQFFKPHQCPDSDTGAVITVPDLHNNFNVEIDQSCLGKAPSFNYDSPKLDSNLVKEIIAKSVRVQIENVYFDLSLRNTTP